MKDESFARAQPEDLWDGPTDFKRKIAIYGGGYTRRLIWDHPLVDDDCEVWSGNHVWNDEGWGADCPRLDRVFDVHLIELLDSYEGERDQKHFRWLQEEHPFTIYMQDPDDRFPSAVRYPFESICAEFFGRQYRGKERKAAFGSMMDFITAMAIYEGADWIGYFGVEMGSSTEHRYQLPYGSLWLGIAAGRRVTTWVPDDPRCQLLRQQVYAYEGFQMVTPETLTEIKANYETQVQTWTDTIIELDVQYASIVKQIEALRQSNGHEIPDELESRAFGLGERLRHSREAKSMAHGAVEAIDHLLQIAVGRGLVSRQSLEALYYDYEKQRRDWLTSSNTWVGGYRALSGQLAEMQENGGAPEGFEQAVQKTGEKVRRARLAAALASGMMFAIKNVIELCDLKEPDMEIRAGLFGKLPMEEVQP